MKRIISLILIVVSSLFLVACNKKTEAGHIDEFWDADQNGIPDWQEEEIELTFATWQYKDPSSNPDQTTIDTLLLDQFMAKYPNIHVTMQFVAEMEGPWNEQIQALAETGGLPDVMLVQRLELTLPANALADITDYYNHDSDTQYIFESLQNNGVYDGVRYALPTFVYPEWWFVNLDLLKMAGIAKPGYDWTWDQMENYAKAVYNETTHVVGQSGYVHYWHTLPKVLSTESSWASSTFDTKNSSWNFESPYFESAMNRMSEALSSHAASAPYSSEQIAEYFGKTVEDWKIQNGYNIGFDGYAGIWARPSWAAKEYFSNMKFNWDVYPAPGIVKNGEVIQTIGGNTDLIAVSSTCAHKAAAYQLLKWMSYSEEGIITRYNDYKDYSSSLSIVANNYPYPIADYGIDANGVNQIWDNLPYDKVPGMTSKEMINALKNGAFNLNKETPGWDAVDRAVNPYFYQITTGDATFESVKETIVAESIRTFAEFNENLKRQIAEHNA